MYVQAKKLVEKTQNNIFVVEWSDIAPIYIVQKDRIRNLLPEENFITLHGDDREKEKQFFSFIKRIKPDIVHLQEVPELWMPQNIAEKFYSKDRSYKIVETSHDSGFAENVNKNKKFLPDGFAFISDFHPTKYSNLCDKYNIPYEIVEFPIIKKDRPNRDIILKEFELDPSYKHILNVGLFTSRKNQSEIFEMARRLTNSKIQFHFIGNQADNFKKYWEPLMEDKPDNCIIWGERNDVDKFYSCMDLFLFTSKGSNEDKETNPLVLKEAIGWNMQVMMYNLDVYCGMYNGISNVNFLIDDINVNINNMLTLLDMKKLINISTLPKRCFITHCDEPYVPILNGLLKSHEMFSNEKLVVVTVNFDLDIEQKNVITIRYDANLDDSPTKHEHYEFGVEGKIKAMILKPSIIQMCFAMGVEELCYIDADVIVNKNIDEMFYYLYKMDNYPLLPEAQFKRMKFNGIITDESISFKEMKIPKENTTWYRQTNSMLVTKSCEGFIREWSQLCKDAISWGWFDDTETIGKYVPFHEETLINYLLWSKQYDERLPQSFFNPYNLDSVKHFFEVGGIYEDSLQINDRMVIDIHEPEVERGWLAYSTNKGDVKYFHGIKTPKIINEIIAYLEEHYEKCKIPMEVSFDEKENKIHFNYQSDRNRYVQIVLRDIDTWLSIYTWTQELVDYNSSFWAIPIPARIFRFDSDPGFNGFRIEYYEIQPDIESDIYLERNKMCRLKSVSDRLLDVQELRLRNNNPTMPFRYKTQNPLHSLTYFNYMEFFYQKIYEDFNFGKDSVVVDVGANIGTFTMYALHRGASKVYALEPVQCAFDDLHNALKSDKVVPLQIAISDSNGELDMYTIPWNDTMASFDKNHIVQHSQPEQDIISFKVKTQKFVDFMYEQNLEKIDLLKVDIEGAEYMMFDAIDDNTLMKVDRLLLEFHDNYNGEFRKHILDKLDKTGFEYTFYQQATAKVKTTEDDHHGIMWAERTKKDIDVLNVSQHKPIIILDAFFHSTVNEKRFLESIEFYKKIGYPIMLVTNSKINQKIQDKVDYIFYDKQNRLLEEEYDKNNAGTFWYVPLPPNDKYVINIIREGLQKHAFSYIVNFLNSIKLAQSLGFTHVMRMEYDQIHHNDDIEFLNSVVSDCQDQGKKGFIYDNKDDISSDFYYIDLTLAINLFPDIKYESDYKKLIKDFTNEDKFLICETLYRYCLEPVFDELIVKDGQDMVSDFHPSTRFNTLTSPSNTGGDLNKGYISSVFRSPTPDHVYIVSCNTHTDDKRDLSFKVSIGDSKSFHKYLHKIDGLYSTQLDHIPIDKEGIHIYCPDESEFYLDRETDLEKVIPSYIRIKDD